MNTGRSKNDILRRLQLMRPIPSALYILRSRGPVGSAGGNGMDRSNQKGGMEMNQPTTYALGLFHGGLLVGFVWIMFKSIGKK